MVFAATEYYCVLSTRNDADEFGMSCVPSRALSEPPIFGSGMANLGYVSSRYFVIFKAQNSFQF